MLNRRRLRCAVVTFDDVCEAVQRLRRERFAPLVPSVLLGMSYGGNGGSPTSTVTDFGDCADFDAAVYWEVRNFGLGERYARSESGSQMHQARWRQVEVVDDIAAEVAELHAQVEARQSQIRRSEMGITAAGKNSYRRNVARIRNATRIAHRTCGSPTRVTPFP